MGIFSKAFFATSIGFALASPLATPAAAASSSFDGTWSVHIAASSSECGNGQTVAIGISNGQVSSSTVSASGRVADAGNISVTLASGIKKANGFGHLSGTSGSGTWRGALCSGTWTASRD
jgi:purine-cytosine permease-like protein